MRKGCSEDALADMVAALRSDTWKREAEQRLAELVEISSHTGDQAGCMKMAEALTGLLTLSGLTVRRHAAPPYGDHVVFASDAAALQLEAPPPFTLLIGHLDTVFPREVWSGQRVIEEGGARVMCGPGAHDMKGGLVSIAFALRALAGAGLLRDLPVRGVVVSDEEVGSPSSQALIREIARGASSALGFESGRAGDAIITRRKGVGSMVVRASGRSAHAGNLHEQGKNAIWALCRFVDAAQGLTDYARGITVNVGRIEGGHGRNVVPDQASALLDFRFVDLDDAKELERRLFEIAEHAPVEGTRITLTGGVARLPLCRTPASSELYARYARCQLAAGLSAAEAPLLGGGSDASTVAPLGIPAIDGLAPRGSGFHTLDERVELETLLPKAEALLRFLLGDYSAVQVRNGPVSA